MKTLGKILIMTILLVAATALVAQTTSYEVKRGTVVSTFNDQLVVKMSTGETKQITVPAGFTFNVDGRDLGLADLKPGMELTGVIKTTKTPETVKVVSIKEGEVLRVMGNTLYVRTNNENKAIQVPAGFKFNVDGRQVGVEGLRKGYRLTAEIVTTSEKVVTERDVRVAGNSPAPAPAPAPAYAAPAEPAQVASAEAEPTLPKTASPLPLIGLLGMALTAAGFAIRRRAA
jgi:CRISPR/Cas system-associated exonuclease Cas4 (RecB family)